VKKVENPLALVSIITPCYNGEKFIHRLLESILIQIYQRIEFIFVNDGSTDKTEDIVLSYKDQFEKAGIVFIYILQENKGQAAALNQGLKIFKGKYLTWPDSDDYLTEDSIADRVKFLENNLEYKLLRSNGIYVHETSLKTQGRISNAKHRFGEHIFNDLFFERTYCCCGCYMIRSDAFFEIYPERQIYESREGQNWQMLIPISSISKCGYIDKDLYCILQRAESHCRQQRSVEEQLKRIDELEAILIDAFQHSNCDYNQYKQLVYEKYARIRIRIAARHQNKDILEQQYRFLKDNKWLSKVDRLIYFREKHKVISNAYQLILLPIRVLRKVKRMLKK